MIRRDGHITYVYMITERRTGRFYIGCRTTYHNNPIKDNSYIGSGCWPAAIRRSNIKVHKDIIASFSNVGDGRILESKIIKKEMNNPKCMNLAGVLNTRRTINQMSIKEFNQRRRKIIYTQPHLIAQYNYQAKMKRKAKNDSKKV